MPDACDEADEADVVAAADDWDCCDCAVEDLFRPRFDLFESAVLLATEISDFSSTRTLHGLVSYDHDTTFDARKEI